MVLKILSIWETDEGRNKNGRKEKKLAFFSFNAVIKRVGRYNNNQGYFSKMVIYIQKWTIILGQIKKETWTIFLGRREYNIYKLTQLYVEIYIENLKIEKIEKKCC